MKLADTARAKFCPGKERQATKRIKIESESRVEFEVVIRSTVVKRSDVCANDRPHPDPLPQEREKRAPLLPNNPLRDAADVFSVNFKVSKGSSLSPGERVRVRAKVRQLWMFAAKPVRAWRHSRTRLNPLCGPATSPPRWRK